jgi:predicted PolB exonuclease-like 3'-5' exonuclease
MSCLVFDIETVPDVALGRRLHGITDLPDEQVAKAMFALRRQRTGGDFLPHEQQRVVAISCVLRNSTNNALKVWSLGDVNATEGELITRFFEGLEKLTPDLVSWNGTGFDLPVLHYRALLWGVQAPTYWETGDSNSAFRYNNYLSRFHWRHIDLMDVLSGFQGRGRVSLQNAATLLGFPGKLGFSGDQVWDAYCRGDLVGIRRYCETDVLNTYLIYLRFQLMRGHYSREEHAQEVERVKALLRAGKEPHHTEFLAAWESQGVMAP